MTVSMVILLAWFSCTALAFWIWPVFFYTTFGTLIVLPCANRMREPEPPLLVSIVANLGVAAAAVLLVTAPIVFHIVVR